MTHIYQHTSGVGQPLALVHGWAMHSGIWRGFAHSLAGRYRVTCLDLPGHGRSGEIDPFTLAAAADALADSYQEASSWWLGWSLGASVVLELARRHPKRVRGLILLAGNPHFTEAENWHGAKPHVLQQFADTLAVDCHAALTRFLALQVNGLPEGRRLLKILKTAVAECAPPNAETLQGGLDILKQADLRPFLAATEKPVLVVSGSHDSLVPAAAIPQIGSLSDNIKTQIIDRAGHLPFLSHPQALRAAITDFLDHR